MFGREGIRAGTHSEQICWAQATSPRPMGLFFACHVALPDDL